MQMEPMALHMIRNILDMRSYLSKIQRNPESLFFSYGLVGLKESCLIDVNSF